MIKPNFATKNVDLTSSYGEFILSPLPAGFGHSLGNALRRALLSSIEGAAITYVKINDVVHPFSSLTGVKETGLDIILNLKNLRFKVAGEGPFTLSLSKKGKGIVSGADFKGGNVEVVNTDQFVAELSSSDAKLEIDITVEKGYGYSGSEEKEKQAFGVLAMDSIYSPVTKVTYKVEDERVGRKTNYDKLTLKVWTDETVSAEQALRQASETLTSFFGHILATESDSSMSSESMEAKAVQAGKVDEKVYETIIDELDLPTRVINALLREKIETVGDLIAKGKEPLVNLKGVGRKSITLIENELHKLGISFND